MKPVMTGLMMPGTVATVLDKPIIRLAYCGAISKWLTLQYAKTFLELFCLLLLAKKKTRTNLNPDQAKPPKPTAIDRQMMAAVTVCV